MNIDATKLKGILDCMDVEADERDKNSAQIRDIVKKAKADGFETKALRKVWQRRRMDADKRQYEDDLLDIYEHALGAKGAALRAIEAGERVGKAAKANGVHRATLARSRNGKSHVANEPSNATPHDPETGEITDEQPPAAIADGEAAEVAIAAPAASGSTVPAGGEAGNAGGSHVERRLNPEPEVARVVPPAPSALERFFHRIENPQPVTPAMRELVHQVGKYLNNGESHGRNDTESRVPAPCLPDGGGARHDREGGAGLLRLGDGQERSDEAGQEEQAAPTESLGAVAKPEAERVATPNFVPVDDGLDIPHFLRRVSP